MRTAQAGDRIRIHYTARLRDDGTVFETTEGEEPMEFTIGEGELIPGFEHGAIGMELGEKRQVEVMHDMAYGEYDPELVEEIDRAQFPPENEILPGQQYAAEDEEGAMEIITVLAVDEDKVVVDKNHPLAGKDLVFELELVEFL